MNRALMTPSVRQIETVSSKPGRRTYPGMIDGVPPYAEGLPWIARQRDDDVIEYGITDREARLRAEAKFLDLMMIAVQMGLSVGWADDLGDHLWAYYLDDHRHIEMNSYLSPQQRVGALAHELGHAVRRDRHSDDAIERSAELLGATLAIRSEEWERAGREVGVEPMTFGAHARSLGCNRALATAYAARTERVATSPAVHA